MADRSCERLAELIRQERQPLLSRWRDLVRELPSARHLDVPTLTDHVPGFLGELAHALDAKLDETIPEALSKGTPVVHGLERLREGFDIAEVVAEYNMLRQCIHDLADSNGLNLQGEPFRIVNLVLDSAIGVALETYSAQRALEVQQRREEYLTFVAHDLRTPLSAISLASSVLKAYLERAGAGGEGEKMLAILLRNTKQLEGLVGKVLEENANLEAEDGIKLERREFYLWPLVEAVIRDLYPVAGTASTSLVNAVPDDFVLYADASLMKRVFQNLVANAIRYTPRGEVVLGAVTREDGQAECWVADNGAGIPGDSLERVFCKGETDAAGEGGLGLGLAIVKSFVEAHGGQVNLESEVGIGTTFRILLPSKSR